jgi:hypothetical protein
MAKPKATYQCLGSRDPCISFAGTRMETWSANHPGNLCFTLLIFGCEPRECWTGGPAVGHFDVKLRDLHATLRRRRPPSPASAGSEAATWADRVPQPDGDPLGSSARDGNPDSCVPIASADCADFPSNPGICEPDFGSAGPHHARRPSVGEPKVVVSSYPKIFACRARFGVGEGRSVSRKGSRKPAEGKDTEAEGGRLFIGGRWKSPGRL